MLRLRGDRSSLLAALVAHWSEQQLHLPDAFLQGDSRATSRRGASAGWKTGVNASVVPGFNH